MAGKGRALGSLTEEDLNLMAPEEGKDVKAGDGESEDDDQKGKIDVDAETAKGMSKGMLVAFFVSALLLPGGVLIVHSFLLRNGVDEEHTACYQRCDKAFVQVARIFKSDYQPELECQAHCDYKQDRASSQADAVLLGGLLLVGGLIFGLGLLSSLESILASFSRGHFVPRAAYKEPMYTEEELRKQARVIGPRERAFWQFVRHPVFDCQTQEVMCRDCKVPVEVDSRWLTGDRGGLQGARCTRCSRIIVGML